MNNTNILHPKINQDYVNRAVVEARKNWQSLVDESGKSQSEFILTDIRAREFLGIYAMIQEGVVYAGFIMPNLLDGVDVTVH